MKNLNQITRTAMERFIAKNLPEYGYFGTADLFREKKVAKLVGFKAREAANEAFCSLLDKVASAVDDIGIAGVYDPCTVKAAIKIIREEEA